MQPELHRAVDLGNGVEASGQRRGCRGIRRGGRVTDGDVHDPLAGQVGHVPLSGLEIQIDHEQVLLELRPAGQHLSRCVDHQRVPVEDELVLTTDEVQVGQGAPGLGGPPGRQVISDVVLVLLVGGPVDHQEQLSPGLAGLGDGAALLPEVLTDRDGHVHVADPDDGEVLAGGEDPELVEDAVVGQVMLGIARLHLALVQHRGAVLGQWPVRRVRQVGRAVKVADDDGQVAVAIRGQRRGQLVQGVPGGLDEGRVQRQVLHGIPGEHHLRERDQVGAGGRGLVRPLANCSRVATQVADGWVDLGQGQSHLRHRRQPIHQRDVQ